MIQFLLGACAGAAVALLCAPMTGKTARAKLKDKAQHKVGDLTTLLEKKKRHVSNQLLGIEHKMSEFGDRACEKAEILKEKLADLKQTVDELTAEFGVTAGEIADELTGKVASATDKTAETQEGPAKSLEDFAPAEGRKSKEISETQSAPAPSEKPGAKLGSQTPQEPSPMPGSHPKAEPSAMPGTHETLPGQQSTPQKPGPGQKWTSRQFGTGA